MKKQSTAARPASTEDDAGVHASPSVASGGDTSEEPMATRGDARRPTDRRRGSSQLEGVLHGDLVNFIATVRRRLEGMSGMFVVVDGALLLEGHRRWCRGRERRRFTREVALALESLDALEGELDELRVCPAKGAA